MSRNKLEQGFTLSRQPIAGIVATLLKYERRVLLFGQPGVGKSTLAAQLAEKIVGAGRPCWCLSADPGSPGFGIPGAVTLGQWRDSAWQVHRFEALCSLDAGRFRLPLISAVQRLLSKPLKGVVLIDGPGVVRGVAGRELLAGLVEATAVDMVLAITPQDEFPPLADELQALASEVVIVDAALEAARPGKRIRARHRTAQWDRYLSQAVEQIVNLDSVNVIGLPPPRDETHAWLGRQVALMRRNQLEAMGEVVGLQGDSLTINLPTTVDSIDSVLIRDAQRTLDGVIETAEPYLDKPLNYIAPSEMLPSTERHDGPRVVGRIGPVDVALVNGVFGDPLLHVRLQHQARSLLFDLGDGGRLSARVAHQVSDVFISHAHMDHIGGFLWLLRSRIGEFPPCRLYGPPGLFQHIEGLINGVLWDRVEDHGPRFEVGELHGDQLKRFRVQAGVPTHEILDEVQVVDGVILTEAGFQVRAVELDHKTPVLAFAFEPEKEINIRKDRLITLGLEPGPWLNELKQNILSGNETMLIELPNGKTVSAASLADELVLIRPGKRLVYATDFADTADNRRQIQIFAHHAHTFFCEATFIEADADNALRNGHLTTRACGEIATAAGVARLLPFHFSRRYMGQAQQLYDEIESVCSCVVVPESMRLFE